MSRDLLDDKERIIYEDDIAAAILVKNACAKGHIQIIPKRPVHKIEELSEEECEHIFRIASSTATVIFETIGAQGTNIISNEDDGFSIDVIARKQDDGLNFQWKPKQLPTNEMDAVMSSIAGKMMLEETTPKNPPKIEDQPQDKLDGDDNYLIKQLERIP